MIGGRIALRLDPATLAAVSAGRQSVLVTGTNGKSTVTALVAAALSPAGEVVSNTTGANMPDGIVTALADDRTSRLAALEVDEAYLGRVTAATHPPVVLALNAFREYTRGVSLAATLAHWREVAARLTEDSLVVVNVDDPLAVWAFEQAPTVVGVGGGLAWRRDAELCPACGATHEWEGSVWTCPGCGRSRPPAQWRVAAPTGHGGWTVVHPGGTTPVSVRVPGRTGPVGAAFALAAADRLGVDLDAAADAIAAVSDVDGRYRPFPVGDRRARLLMLKNPAGWSESVDLAVSEDLPFVLALDPFGPKDTTTLWEGGLERLADRGAVPVTGGRAADGLAILEAAGIPGREVADATAAIRSAPDRGTGPDVIVACNYPAFRRLSRELRRAAPNGESERTPPSSGDLR